MLNKLSDIKNNYLFKIFSLNSIHVFLKLLFGFFTSKAIALYVGPSGMGLLGNFRSFLGLIENIALLGFQNGIVKYISEHKDHPIEYRKIVFTSGIIVLFSTLLLSLFLIFAVDFLTHSILKDQDFYQYIFYLMALLLPFYIGSVYIISIVNGLHHYKSVILVQLISGVLTLGISLWLIIFFNTIGALLSLLIGQVVLCFILIFYSTKNHLFKGVFSFQNFDVKLIKNFSEYAFMALISGVIGSFILLQIRNEIINQEGLFVSGVYEGLQRISSYYLLFISTIISLYFLPKLAQQNSIKEEKEIVRTYLYYIIPIFGLGLIALFFIRDFVIQILFSPEFKSMENLFFWQLLGDFLKAISLLFGYILIAKKQTKIFIITEISSLLILYFSTHFLLQKNTIIGVVQAYSLTYFIYLIVLIFYFRKLLFSSSDKMQ